MPAGLQASGTTLPGSPEAVGRQEATCNQTHSSISFSEPTAPEPSGEELGHRKPQSCPLLLSEAEATLRRNVGHECHVFHAGGHKGARAQRQSWLHRRKRKFHLILGHLETGPQAPCLSVCLVFWSSGGLSWVFCVPPGPLSTFPALCCGPEPNLLQTAAPSWAKWPCERPEQNTGQRPCPAHVLWLLCRPWPSLLLAHPLSVAKGCHRRPTAATRGLSSLVASLTPGHTRSLVPAPALPSGAFVFLVGS